MRNATQDLRESSGPRRRPDDEGAAAGGRDGSHPEGPSSCVQALVVPSPTEQPSAAGRRAKHGRAFGRHSQQ